MEVSEDNTIMHRCFKYLSLHIMNAGHGVRRSCFRPTMTQYELLFDQCVFFFRSHLKNAH